MRFPPGRWRGQWIWSPRPTIRPAARGSLLPEAYDRRVLFRRVFTLDEVPETAPFRVTADSRYVLYVNGTELARGPVRHGPRTLHYDTGDAAPALREGRNAVAVLARFYGHATPWWEPSPPTFTLGGGCLVAELRLGEEWLVTDETWTCHEPTAWTPAEPRHHLLSQLPEIFDARKLDPGWTLPDHDDGPLNDGPLRDGPLRDGPLRVGPLRDGPLRDGPPPDGFWRPVRVIEARAVVGGNPDAHPPSDPFGALHPRPIPPLTSSVRQAELGPDLVADFGQVVSGTLRLAVRGRAGSTVSGAVAEVVTPAGLEIANRFAYTLRGHDDVFEMTDPVGGRYAVLEVTGGAEVASVEVVERLRPRPAGPYFACSDPELDAVFLAALRTVDLTSHDAYIDCPTREQRAWTGDSVVHQSVDLVANPDWSLARHHPALAAQPRPDGMLPMVVAGDFAAQDLPTIPDWSLHWIRSVHNLYRYTGDRSLVAGLLASAEGVLRWFLPFRGDDGLLHDVTGWVLIDWSPVQVRGTSAALNALWGRALADFAEMAEWLGDLGRAWWARDLHAALARGFEVFWDVRRGAYRDHLLSGSVSEHTAAAAVCAGLVPASRHPAVRELLLDRAAMFTRSPMGARGADRDGPISTDPVSLRPAPDWDVDQWVVGAQPFFRYVVHDALALLGAAGRIAGLCRDWTALTEAGTFRECWDGGSYCHGWSATPARDLLVHTLGITPAEPGYTRVRVAPRLGELAWARGAVPSPHGLIEVEVHGTEIKVDAPVPVEIVRP
ncbi:family 78 glycoside hydrolase catalytic domain [Nonomuraea sp. NPDC050394]|uniref:family 78 glycoside hydrolase catalytic domain n=1 Tax=Nonomuraea sp. NPDC050394 TaxID=3364363 RepID=UPI0037AE0398